MRRVCITRARAWTPRGVLTVHGFEKKPAPFEVIRRFRVDDFPTKIAAQIEGNGQVPMSLTLIRETIEDHFLRMSEANIISTLGETSRSDRGALGIFVGAEPERVPLEDLSLAQNAVQQSSFAVLGKLAYEQRSPARLTKELAKLYQAEGPQLTLSMACAASASATAKAWQSIRSGQCDVAVCVGAAFNVEPLLFAGFCLLRAMSSSGKCQPFDQKRDGFVLSDGFGCLLLEAEDFVVSQGRQKEILGYLEGAGESLDAYRITDPEPSGIGAKAAIHRALQSAQIEAKEVSLLKAHATGTIQNDRVEAQVLSELFSHNPPVLALKGGLGHSIAACGVVELIAALASLRSGRVENAFGLSSLDSEISSINVMPWNETNKNEREFSGRYALCNTFGFGGINCALLVSVL
jgi:3-oxoacyl-[acyl-carrier-protein] synthase II